MFSSNKLNIYARRLKNSYVLVFINGRMTGHLMQKHSLIGACDYVQVRKLVMSV